MDISTIQIDNPYTGIIVYRGAVPRSLNIPERLESLLTADRDPWFKWSPALVGDFQSMPDYRDCVDFKVRKKEVDLKKNEELSSIYYDVDAPLQACLKEYTQRFHINMEYQEAVNFVRYGEGQHFAAHSDHGFSYVCAVSTVIYLNDGYEGGGLHFPHINFTYTPQAGDIVLFPSSWIYTHAALPVTSGIKYSGVTMFDYTDRYHSDEFNHYMYKKTEHEKLSKPVNG